MSLTTTYISSEGIDALVSEAPIEPPLPLKSGFALLECSFIGTSKYYLCLCIFAASSSRAWPFGSLQRCSWLRPSVLSRAQKSGFCSFFLRSLKESFFLLH
uniref:Uncharacterized protein n=1 Tax=Halimeda micronesica TaxID=170426 RepID=A0A386AXG1_9CHLO|nr:hypothetical protein [Halimeda micronesica]